MSSLYSPRYLPTYSATASPFSQHLYSNACLADDPCSELTSFRPFETDVTSPTVIAAARQLIASCQDSHLDCHDKVDAQPPSRIIDVGKIKVNEVGVGEVDAGKWPCVKLRNTRDLELKDYVALSYCWGGEQPMKLLSTNRAKYEDCVLLAELPKTLQDAVECTRALGYRYLWVDALCIMQDVQSEKLKEIGNMASIYRNAAVTIIAAVARSVNEGYLNYDRLSSIQSKFGFKESKPINCHIEVELNNGQIGTLVIIPEIVWDDPKTMPINERGWCLQESVLPRRLLYYGPEELLFRCHTIDCQPMTPSVIDYTKGINPPRILSHQQRGSNPKSLWHDFVLDFSERKVSVPADRTYAITGIIEELQWRWDDECIWGIWKSRLLEDLCWKRREGTSVRTQHAPCWSWMSFNGGIVEVNHRPFEHVDAIFHGIAGKELHLTCRVMTNIMIKFHKRYFERCQADVEITEADTNEINYLYIGSTKQEEWSDSVDIAIAAIELEKGVFRREGLLQIGIPEYGGTAEFMEPEPTKITLI